MSPLHVYSAFQHNLCDRLKGHVGAALCGRPSVVPRHNVHPKRGGHGGPPLHVYSAFQHNLSDRQKGHVGAALCGRPSVVPRRNVYPKRGGHGGPPLHLQLSSTT